MINDVTFFEIENPQTRCATLIPRKPKTFLARKIVETRCSNWFVSSNSRCSGEYSENRGSILTISHTNSAKSKLNQWQQPYQSIYGFFDTITTMGVEGNLFSLAHGSNFFVKIGPNLKWQIYKGNNKEPADIIELREILILSYSRTKSLLK